MRLHRDLFETWLEKSLIPQLQPRDIIIIDNASFHKGQSIKEIVEEVGCEIWYLPAYSPDLNKRCDPAAVSAAGSRTKTIEPGVVCSQNLDRTES